MIMGLAWTLLSVMERLPFLRVTDMTSQ